MRYQDKPHRDICASDLEFSQVADQAEAALGRAPFLATAAPATLGTWTRWVIVATAVWSAIELPLEIWVSVSPLDAIACLTTTVLWIALVGLVLAGSRVARTVYGFLCTIGMMAVAFALPVAYQMFPLAFGLSVVECALKATAFVCLVSAGIYPEEG